MLGEIKGLQVIEQLQEKPATIPELFYNTVRRAGNNPANIYKTGREWKTVSYSEWADISEEIAWSLIKLGIKKGDDVCIISQLSAQRGWADLAIQLCAAVTTTAISLLSDDDLIYIIRRSDIKVVFVESPRFMERIEKLQDEVPSLKAIICLQEGYQGDEKLSWGLKQFRAYGIDLRRDKPTMLEQRWKSLTTDDPARLNYSLNFIGEIKESKMQQKDWLKGETAKQKLIVDEKLQGRLNDVTVSVLPISSLNERTYAFMAMIATGALIKYGHGPSRYNSVRDVRRFRK